MQIKATVKIGLVDYEFTFDEREEMESLHKAAVLTTPYRKCTECGNDDQAMFKLDSNKDKEGNIYLNVMCKCGAKSKLGQYKAGGFFWHKFETYNKERK